jgi:general transcription factor 3C polypeptide 5 (transcription factor C subunit 1)
MENSNDAVEESASTEPPKCAPAHGLPTTHFYSIEYPGYVRPESVGKAVDCLGGQSSIDRAFRRNPPKEDSLLELNLRPDNPFSHPLPGDLVPTNNILLRVVKRRLKRPLPNDGGGGSQEIIGEYTAVAVGVIPKTARFRSEQSLSCRLCERRCALRAFLIEVWPTFSTNRLKTILSPNFARR